jgi:hypothetical protein
MTVRDQAFLYCFLIYGQQKEEILAVLPAERAETLKKEVKKFDRFPKEVRLTIVLKLLGYLVQHIRNRNLEMVHPTWIAESLRNENASITLGILNQFSSDYRERVLDFLTPFTSPVFDPLKSVSSDCSDVVLQIFCNRFASMSAPWGEAELNLDTLYLLKEEDLDTLVFQLGVREIARAFVLAGNAALAAVVSRIPAYVQEDFLAAVKVAKTLSPERQKAGARRLAPFASRPLEEAMTKVGLVFLGEVFSHGKTETARKVAQRLPREMGVVILETMEKQSERLEGEEDDIMSTIHELTLNGKIDKNYVETRFRSADPDARLKMSKQNILG